MPEFIRSFVAIPVTATRTLKQFLNELTHLRGPIRVLDEDELHVTLTFLGDTPINRTPEIIELIRESMSHHGSFDLRFLGLGAFPDQKRPRVVWAGLDPQEPLRDMANELSSRLAAVGFPKEDRRYNPHLTLARVKGRPPQELFALFDEFGEASLGRCDVDRVVYYQSELLSDGPKYTSLAEFELDDCHDQR